MFKTTAHRVPLADIKVARATRQRQEGRDEAGEVDVESDGLLASVERDGILSPILLHRDGTLIFGERRLTCAARLGLADIPAVYIEELTPDQAERLELIENVKRQELHWKDEVLALARYHDLSRAAHAGWTLDDTEREMGYKQGSHWMRVARALKESDGRIARCISMREAFNLLMRGDARAEADIINDITDAGVRAFEAVDISSSLQSSASPSPGAAPGQGDAVDGGSASSTVIPLQQTAVRSRRPVETPAEESILLIDFSEWIETYSGPRFNFVHCDFPYGKGVFSGPMSGRGRWAETYNDDVGVYWRLIDVFCSSLDKFMAPSAHLMFWLAADVEIQAKTIEVFRQKAPSLVFDTYPLTWIKSDNAGIAPDSRRRARRITETALMASRDDRLLVKLVGNGYSAPTDKVHHPHTKPEPVLRHFFSMFIDTGSKVFDPTAGGGSALRAAESLGAERVLGLESSPEHHAAAVSALRVFRNKRRAAGEV